MGIYSINWTIGDKFYIGETTWSFKKRLYEHHQALLKNDASYTSVVHHKNEG